MIKVTNMTSNKGNKIPNQFIITAETDAGFYREYFQSYTSVIAMRQYAIQDIDQRYGNNKMMKNNVVFLDPNYWNYSKTTSRYLNQFLNLTSKEVKLCIDKNIFQFRNLN